MGFNRRQDNEGLQRGENIIFVSFVIFCLESSARSLLCFWFALIRDIRVIRGCRRFNGSTIHDLTPRSQLSA
jgi:hypothetical protein